MSTRRRQPPPELMLVDPRKIVTIFLRLCDATADLRRHMMAIAAALDAVIEEAQQRAKAKRKSRS